MPPADSRTNVATFGNSGSTSASLLERVRKREHEAWQRLVEIYGPLIYQWCRHCSLQSQDSADVAQEVFVAVARSIEGFRRDRPGDTFRGWLWTITRNKIRDHLHRVQAEAQAIGGTAAVQQMASIPAGCPAGRSLTGTSIDEKGLGAAAMASVRARFEDHTWQAFWRTTVGHELGTAVAADLGLSVQAVYQAKYRVLNALRGELGELLQ